jgi:hypothetical protein
MGPAPAHAAKLQPFKHPCIDTLSDDSHVDSVHVLEKRQIYAPQWHFSCKYEFGVLIGRTPCALLIFSQNKKEIRVSNALW